MNRRDAVRYAIGAIAVSPRAAMARSENHRHPSQSQSAPRIDAASPDTTVARLRYGWVAGQPKGRIDDSHNDPFIISIEEQLKCTCGCPHSIHTCRTVDFSCQYWQPLHAKITEMARSGLSADEIIAAYVEEHGEAYLMAPPPEGFNLAGYLLPTVVIAFVASLLVWILVRRSRLGAEAAVPVASAPSGISDADAARIEAELKELDP